MLKVANDVDGPASPNGRSSNGAMVNVAASGATDDGVAADMAAEPVEAAAAAAAARNGDQSRTPGGLRRAEVVRLMVQAMRELGFRALSTHSNAAATLEHDSGYYLESPSVARLHQCILQGRWKEAEAALGDIAWRQESGRSMALFLIAEQRFLELLEARDTRAALQVLRNELAEHCPEQRRLQKLSSLVMCSSAEDVRKKAEWAGAEGGSRAALVREIQSHISVQMMIPPGRLEHLLLQAQAHQQSTCLYHNSVGVDGSLLEDHMCDRHDVPRVTKHVFTGHTDEVWDLNFSPDGRMLASASKDKTVIVWDLATLTAKQTLRGHQGPISFLIWSPDSRWIVSCSNDKTARLWNTQTGACAAVINEHTEAVTAAAWLPDSKLFVTGSLGKTIFLHNLDGEIAFSWRGPRVVDLAVDAEGKKLVVASQDKRLLVYRFGSDTEEANLCESDMITSLALTRDGAYALVNLASQQIHLWDLAKGRPVQKYTGHVQNKYIIRSCFGGVDESFILSGSEDCQVYLWQRHHNRLLEVLPGHSGLVNSVAWSTADPTIFASASDDNTVRLWGPAPTETPPGSNGVAAAASSSAPFANGH